jgi:hypothetical protein
MPEPEGKPVVGVTSSKKELLAAYKELQKQLQERREGELKPEQKLKERQDKAAVETAEAIATEGIGKQVATLKAEISRVLADLSDKMDEATARWVQVKRAVEVKEAELVEIYEIQKAASTLAALLEAQRQKREQFESDMAGRKAALDAEIEETRAEWSGEKQAREAEAKEREGAEKKAREREAEEFKYRSARERQLAKEEFEFEKSRLQRELQVKREELERGLAEREKALKERETELAALQQKAAAFPKELDAAVAKAVKEATERLTREAAAREELLRKDAEAEQKVLSSRIEALQETVKAQAAQIARLSAQIEKSYGQVQDIAVKAIEGSANAKTIAALQAQAAETGRRAAAEQK